MTRDSGRSSLSWLSRLSPLARWPVQPVHRTTGKPANRQTGQRANGPNGRGQSTVETALLLTVVAMALLTFFTFIRAAVSSRIKVGADTFGHGLLHDGN